MAFTGTPAVVQLNDHTVRISGVSLGILASGTIGLTGSSGGAPDITLPANFRAAVYTYNGTSVAFQDSIQCWVEPTTTGPLTNLPCSVTKTGTAVTDFRITITNTNSGLATQDLEILVWSAVPFVGSPSQIA